VSTNPRRAGARKPRAKLKEFLEDAHERFHRPEFLSTDPLVVAHRYRRREDREVTALIAAAFASGNIKAILKVLDQLLAVMGPRPAEWLAAQDPRTLEQQFAGIYHRWVQTPDIAVFLAVLGEALRTHGDLASLWKSVDDPAEPNTFPALGRFVEQIMALPVPIKRRERLARCADGTARLLAPMDEILLPSPRRGSACKRMHLFLRWMARPADGIDLGLWSGFLSRERLVMPVDVHVLRIAQQLRLTDRRTPDRRAAEEITAALKSICPEDPTRYDFSLVRVGIEANLRRRRSTG
jgi:uncharacterized protein (TIGR02757 family)